MDIKVNVEVGEVDLTTVVTPAEGYEDDGPYRPPVTLATVIAQEAVRQNNDGLRTAVREVRTELIREALAPIVAAAVAAPVQKTNTYGEPAGSAVTLREVIIDEVKKYLDEPADNYHRNRGSRFKVALRDEVDKAFRAEMRAELAGARKAVKDRVVAIAAEELTR